MTHDEVFLQDILDNPHDDTVRLIYADWLEEQGDPRGEFIQVQCRLAQLAQDDPLREELAERELALFAAHGEQWLLPLRDLILDWTFRRGFVEDVTITLKVYLEQRDRLFRLAPIQRFHVDLTGAVIPPEIVEFVPESVARENVIFPLAWDWGKLTVAMKDPGDLSTIDKLQFIFNRYIEPVPALVDPLLDAINRHYGQSETESVDSILVDFVDVALDPPVEVRLVNLILTEAIALGATAISLVPLVDAIRVRYLLDGAWQERDHPPRRLLDSIVSRLKVMASITGDERQRPQKGQLRIGFNGKSYHLGVQFQPTKLGPFIFIAL